MPTFDATPAFEGTPRFQVISRLGVGGMGEVFEVLDRERDTRVALKRLKAPSAEAILRFKNEFRAMQDVQHPNLVLLGELVEEAGEWFFTMELVEGVDFLTWVRPDDDPPRAATDPMGETSEDTLDELDTQNEPPAFDERRLRSGLRQLSSALAALHAAGKIHQDVKPANVCVTPDGRLALLDFGLVTDVVGETQPGSSVAGTVAYMAPEQASTGVVGPEADWYSLGVMLYQAMTGRLPASNPIEVARLAAEERAPSRVLPRVPTDLDELCVDLLRTDPAERPRDEEVVRRLRSEAVAAPYDSLPVVEVPLVGRRRELERLHDIYRDMRAGGPRAVLVEGESGVGKTALVRRFTDQLAFGHRALGEQQASILRGRCHERESVPFKAFDGIVDSIARNLSRLPVVEQALFLPRSPQLLAQVFPVLRRVEGFRQRGAPAPVEKIERRVRVFGAVRDLLARLAERSPLILVIDDLQWADADSLALLREVLRPPDAPRMLVVGTVRAGGAPVDVGVPVERLAIGGLGPEEALELGQLLASALGPDGGGDPAAADSTIARVAAEAGGHPLFMSELVRYAQLHPGAGSDRLRLDQALWARVRQLPIEARRLVEVVTVAGVPVRQDVAARAADLKTDAAHRAFLLLRGANLVRTSGLRPVDSVEPYHDRVREAVVANLTTDARAATHRRLAAALEASADSDPELLATHWHGAGRDEQAVSFAVRAADAAMAALAFDRAARMYRFALDMGKLEDGLRREVSVRLGDALINAGHGAEAAAVLLGVAGEHRSEEALPLRMRAAAELLRSGRTEEGKAELIPVLRDLGFRWPATRHRALLSLGWQRAKIRVRGLAFDKRDEGKIAPRALLRIDACSAVGLGLSMVDPVRGADFQARELLLALEAGEPNRVVRALALEGAFLATRRPRGARRGAELLTLAGEIASGLPEERTKLPAALVQLAWSVHQLLQGRWKASLAAGDAAAPVLAERGIGVAWERMSAQYYPLCALLWMGEFEEVKRRLPALLLDADARGDRYMGSTLRNGLVALLPVALDEPERARAEARRVIEETPGEYQFQHYWHMLAIAHAHLYEGNAAAALATVDEHWDAVAASMVLRVHYIRIEAWWLRARALVAMADVAPPSEQARLRRRAAADARRLCSEAIWSRPMGQMVRAALAHAAGNRDAAMTLLGDASSGFDETDQTLFALIARWHRARFLGGDVGRSAETLTATEMKQRGVRVPERMARLFGAGLSVPAER